jgi:hypothetical protein
MAEALFMTQRRRILEAYKGSNEAFSASTKPYKSTVAFSFQGANTIALSAVRWLIARPGQRFEWFGYKIADQVPGDPPAGGYRPATEADTNLSKARTTNGAEDFVIEGISASCRSVRLSYAVADGGAFGAEASAAITDSDAILAFNGRAPIMDPAALYAPPQVQSPFNLENALYRALSPHIAVEFEWDRNKVVKIGTLEQIPEGGANSYLRSSGEPSTNDRYRVPEGYLWRREGQPDSEFITRGTVTEPVAVPILSVSLPSTVTPAVATVGRVWLDVLIRLHGLSVKIPSRN